MILLGFCLNQLAPLIPLGFGLWAAVFAIGIGYFVLVTSKPFKNIWSWSAAGTRRRKMGVVLTAGVVTGLLGAGIAWLLIFQAQGAIERPTQSSERFSTAARLGIPTPAIMPLATLEVKPASPHEIAAELAKELRKENLGDQGYFPTPTPLGAMKSPRSAPAGQPQVSQTMIGSPGGMQAGGDINIRPGPNILSFRGAEANFQNGTITLQFEPARDEPLGELRFGFSIPAGTGAKIVRCMPGVTAAGVEEQIANDGQTATLRFTPLGGGPPMVRLTLSKPAAVDVTGNRLSGTIHLSPQKLPRD